MTGIRWVAAARSVLVLTTMWRLLMIVAICVGMPEMALARPGVVIASSLDATRGDRENVELVKQTLAKHLPETTASRQLDLSIASLTMDVGADRVVVTATLRIAISDEAGAILSVLSGCARVEVPTAAYRAYELPSMQRDALVGATEAMAARLRAVLPSPSLLRLGSLDFFARWLP